MTGCRPAGKALAVDLGSRRIGIAACDSARSMAFPLEVIERRDDVALDARAIGRLVGEIGATTIVVGLPLSLDGSEGPAAQRARTWAHELAARLSDVSVVLFDERLTTVSATAAMAAAGRSGRAARRRVDAAAATVLLQSWLDARDSQG